MQTFGFLPLTSHRRTQHVNTPTLERMSCACSRHGVLFGIHILFLILISGQTPLMHAILSGKTAAAKYLLAHGADYTIGEKDGW